MSLDVLGGAFGIFLSSLEVPWGILRAPLWAFEGPLEVRGWFCNSFQNQMFFVVVQCLEVPLGDTWESKEGLWVCMDVLQSICEALRTLWRVLRTSLDVLRGVCGVAKGPRGMGSAIQRFQAFCLVTAPAQQT